MTVFSAYHAHVYYEEQTFAQAEVLCNTASERFNIAMGRMHKKNVGPHPKWSCQLAFSQRQFSEFIPWLMKESQGLTILIHPISDDHLKDHRDYPMWIGKSEILDLSLFEKD
ncbi:DOPA 4,5-dioxygenase family protein [Neptuniibacter sp.]|uniref:DOPA 4,5-dioxygenase family protein n=1 Tax=Neptuniibacter sp. TaxID=1962643 RepID=UPI0026287F6D|nr:DOPA 4,5-dioxygenase family protein [Neptuniibacter sp.]MCP4598822.1 DOPA 4,5-dioxygenase family protein [Neptuniibacter sp.]